MRRLPRWALLLFCAAYVLPGFLGREPWKNADITAFGYMAEMAHATAGPWRAWLAPRLMGLPPEADALLPYWLGAAAIRLVPAAVPADLAARLPFMVLLALALAATWYAVYHLARSPGAQPVAFAFGGEARPADYARAMADGGLLALLACLGLAQLSHETTPALTQLCATALLFHGLAAASRGGGGPLLAGVGGLLGLTLSGAPTVALLLGAGGILLLWADTGEPDDDAASQRGRAAYLALLAAATGLSAALALGLDLWRWRLDLPEGLAAWRSLGRLLLWFTWPAWPLVLWSLWGWRRQIRRWRAHRHLALPLWFALVPMAGTLITAQADRALLLALPALATLAAFALPTLQRSVSALVDWFTLLFFSGCAVTIWVVWLAMQTGWPRQPAANVARLVPGFVPSFSAGALAVAAMATVAWLWLVRWRVGRHRAAIWKSLVLPAGGAALCWLLLMSLWLPMLDYARSYGPLVQGVAGMTGPGACTQVHGLSRGQIAALRWHAQLQPEPASPDSDCPWLLVSGGARGHLALAVDTRDWALQATLRRPSDRDEDLLLLRRVRLRRP